MATPTGPDPDTPLLNRRGLLSIGGTLVVGAVVLAACGGDDATPATSAPGTSTTTPSSTAPSSSAATTAPSSSAATTAATTASTMSTGTPASTVFTAADFAPLGTCQVLPDLTQGPFPTLEQIERRDITEGNDGLPLRVGVQIVDETCVPIPGAVVEIWHCDIDGDYSAYADGNTADDAGEGTTAFRGFQLANDDGIVEFTTVYPGWYRGRAVHIHAKVHIDDETALTTQFLFDDALNTEIFAAAPYAAFGDPDTTNADDMTAGGTAAPDGLLMSVSADAAIDGRRGLIVVGLDPTGASAGMPPGSSGPAGPGGGPGATPTTDAADNA